MPTTPTTSLPIPNDFGIIFHKEDRDVEEEALPQPTRFTRDEDIRLLAMACTAEAETESEFGRELVIATVINRAENNNTSIRRELSKPHQFPWWGRTRRINPECEDLARRYVLNHPYDNVTHFHHRRIRPTWARRMPVSYREGAHIFYNLQ